MNKGNIFIVEGKTDTSKLKSIYENIETFETNGNRINKKRLNTIKLLHKNNNIYIMTDPDFIGNKIRNIISNALNNDCYHVYIQNYFSNKNNKKNGIAEINKEILINSINKAKKFDKNTHENNFSYNEYLNLKLNNKNIRLYICNKLNICYFNHIKLYKILNFLNININYLKRILEGYKREK